MSEKQAYYPLLGTWGPVGPDHMAEQVYQTTGEFPGYAAEPPSVVDKPSVEYDPTVHWRTKEGELVLIPTLSDRHLRNCLRMLWRMANRWAIAYAMGPGPLGELARDAFDDECGRLGSASPSELIRLSPAKRAGGPLLDEWERRGYADDTWWAAS